MLGWYIAVCVLSFLLAVMLGAFFLRRDDKTERARKQYARLAAFFREQLGWELVADYWECRSAADLTGAIAARIRLVEELNNPVKRDLLLGSAILKALPYFLEQGGDVAAKVLAKVAEYTADEPDPTTAV